MLQMDYLIRLKGNLNVRVKLDYTYGLGKIYTEAEIENAKHSPSFKREYQLFYLGLEGNIFSPLHIDKAIELGEKYKDLPTLLCS